MRRLTEGTATSLTAASAAALGGSQHNHQQYHTRAGKPRNVGILQRWLGSPVFYVVCICLALLVCTQPYTLATFRSTREHCTDGRSPTSKLYHGTREHNCPRLSIATMGWKGPRIAFALSRHTHISAVATCSTYHVAAPLLGMNPMSSYTSSSKTAAAFYSWTAATVVAMVRVTS